MTMRDGRMLEHREATNRGSDANPLSESDIIKKFRGNAGIVLNHPEIERLKDAVWHLDTAPDLTELTRALTSVENAKQ